MGSIGGICSFSFLLFVEHTHGNCVDRRAIDSLDGQNHLVDQWQRLLRKVAEHVVPSRGRALIAREKSAAARNGRFRLVRFQFT